jgi:isoleucyl-tRNA synthetase
VDTAKKDYKDTLRLPKTDFSMKADLARREPEILKRWRSENLVAKILEARKDAPRFTMHDGPPYANGHIHYGHILNKTLKDIVVKTHAMAGFRAEFRPGWDCHGLPIELAVLREKGGADLGPLELRAACDAYAHRWVQTQRDEFERLGIFATWDRAYLTLQPHYEGVIISELATFAERGLLYRARRPVHWCTSDKTALAEAEIEYDEKHVSPSIYVKFATPEAGLYAVIWTTTPWTLPANHAIAYHPNFAYVTVEANGERYIVARDLADKVVAECKLTETSARQPFSVERFAQLRAARHPFIDRESLLVPADYVTLEQGTGLVHTAPGHGTDDFATGKKYNLPVDAPVDDSGRFTGGPWKGELVWKANPAIVKFLAEQGVLLSPTSLTVTHKYPLCWRCKNPVIFRATWQWFASMDEQMPSGTALRAGALAAIGETQWIPPWGENRIRGMIENRPDWVLSRQRHWGVPIPVLYDKETDEPVAFDHTFMRAVAAVVEKEGADAWFRREADDLAKLAGRNDLVGRCKKGNDIVDVWFESGVSWAAVCLGNELDASRPDDNRPVDLYLEGSDQHRGWFHSTLLVGIADRGRAPYRAVLTHGFVVDENGRAYSKSEIEKARREGRKVEYIPPEDVIREQGAELLRMWVATADFRNDVAYSRSHLGQLGESYRKIRNTARFLLGNLSDFDPAHRVEATDPLDKWLAARTAEVFARGCAAYRAYELHVVMRLLIDFCAVDLSAIYLDVRKDRLYCDAADGAPRRATQTALYDALRAVVLLAAPVMCFTADEIWGHMKRLPSDPDNVHLAVWPKVTAAAAEDLAPLLALRGEVQKALEPFRAQKKSSLDAHVRLTVDAATADKLRALPEGWLADFLIVSAVDITAGEHAVTVEEAKGHRCARCWKWTPREPICERCNTAIA